MSQREIAVAAVKRYRAMADRRVTSPHAWQAMASRLRLCGAGCAARGRRDMVPLLDALAFRAEERAGLRRCAG